MKKDGIALRWAFTIFRILVGWYILYEGIDKLLTPGWTAEVYLMNTRWIFSGLFHQIAENPGIMKIVDFINIWGLIFIGISLFIGLLVRYASIFGALLLLLYFVAYPPIPGFTFGTVVEGSYIWVNKTLIILSVLIIFILLPNGFGFGIDRLIKRWKKEKPRAPIPTSTGESLPSNRREILRDLISVPFIGAFTYAMYKKKKWSSFEEKYLGNLTDANTSATIKTFHFASLKELKEPIPKSKIGNVELSRVIAGGNLIGGWAHARDLLYASDLVKSYHTDERVMMTLQLAEKCGINTIISNISLSGIINRYKHETGGKIQFISDSGQNEENIIKSVEEGASAIYFHGEIADKYAQEGKFDEIAKSLELIRSYGMPAGIGCHLLDTVKGCVNYGIKPDFWMKTLHHHNYWSAQVDVERKRSIDKGFKDNMFCFHPVETINFMNSLDEPWIAFKVLAAGAIHPSDGVRYAFENGADFVCLGMYDFQIVEDSNIVVDVLNSDFMKNRERRWMS